tara:strand:+ start:15844 stop:16437 length:594 start_codon:yes stop_codon:yes gene_type:complete
MVDWLKSNKQTEFSNKTHCGDIDTPLGSITITASADILLSQDNFSFEIVEPPHFTLFEGQAVDHINLYQLTIKPTTTALKIIVNFEKIDCEDCYPESGECYVSIRLEKGAFQMNVGTRDGEYLNYRLYPDRHKLPYEAFELIEFNLNERYMVINVPALQDGETIVISFSTAWKNNSNDEDCSTWEAADRILPSLKII